MSKNRTRFMFLGRVDAPGEYILDEPDRQITIIEAIGMAGGYTEKAEPQPIDHCAL